MNAEFEAPEEFADALSEWAYALHLLHEPLRAVTLANAWIAGLVAGGIKAANGTVWGAGKYSRKLPFVIEFPCPFDHRTPDEYDYARVRLVIRDNGWWSLDPASPCQKCNADAIAAWLLACPLCEAGEDSERHYPDHSPLDVFGGYDIDGDYDDSRGFDASPVSWVVREFERLRVVAAARWWIGHTEEAAARLPRWSESVRQRYVSGRLAWARGVLASTPKARKAAVSSKPMMTPEAGVVWLDEQKIPAGGEKATWARVKDLPGCPAQSVIYAAVKLRKSRTTEA